MITKKASNTLSLLATLWTGTLILLFMLQRHSPPASQGSPLIWLSLAVLLLLPMIVVYVNSRVTGKSLPLFDQILQSCFNIFWFGMGFVYVFFHESVYLLAGILSAELALAIVILLRCWTLAKKTNEEPLKKNHKLVLFLVLNLVTIWMPICLLIGMGVYINVVNHNGIDSGFLLLPFFEVTAPFFVSGIFVSMATLVWQARVWRRNRRELRMLAIILGWTWAIQSGVYIAMWVWVLGSLVSNYILYS